MKGGHSLLVAVVMVAGLVGVPSTVMAATPERPNIVVVLVDDLGAVDGRLWPFLPTIHRTLVQRGWQFTNFHVETSFCCPGRAGFLTGLHTHHHGVRWNDAKLYDPSESIATGLDRAGYRTFFVGKFMNLFAHIARERQPGWDDLYGSGGGYYEHSIWHNGGLRQAYGSDEEDYSTDVYADLSVEAMRRARPTEPLFGIISPFAPHDPTTPAQRHVNSCQGIEPWQPPNYNEQDVSDKPAYVQERAPLPNADGYPLGSTCRALLAVDDLVRTVRQELRAQGRLRNTLFIVTADNGMAYGAHRFDSKANPYSTQIPFLASWPERWGTTPRTVGKLLSNIDLAPTLCELAGCTLGPYPTGQAAPDGTSFASILRGRSSVRRDAVLQSWLMEAFLPRWYGVMTTKAWQYGRWHYVEYETGERELYDLVGDPWEMENRAGKADVADVEAALRDRLHRLIGEPPGW